jgi:hypothetical protein
MHDIIASSDAWTITDEAIDEDDGAMDGQRPTVSARQVKALIEQVTGASLFLHLGCNSQFYSSTA